MTVRCPRCGTTYRRPARSRADATFRCARCRHVFDVTGKEPTLAAGDEDDFEPDDDFVDEPVTVERTRDEPAFTQGDDEEDEPAAPAEKPEPAPEPTLQGASPTRFAVRAVLVITLAYAVLSVYLYTHPESVQHAFGGVPFLGPGLMETRINPGNIQLTDVHGAYQRVKGDRLVFLIAATAVNNARIPVRGIQVQGRIAGAKETRQAVFCGAARREVQDLSLREIALLQALEPPKDWTLAPGEQASCVVVFTEPAEDLREFSAEVVAVQAPPRDRGGEGLP